MDGALFFAKRGHRYDALFLFFYRSAVRTSGAVPFSWLRHT